MKYMLILLICFLIINCQDYFHVEPYKESHEVKKGVLPIHYADGSNHDYFLISTNTIFDYIEYCNNDSTYKYVWPSLADHFAGKDNWKLVSREPTFKGFAEWLEAQYD